MNKNASHHNNSLLFHEYRSGNEKAREQLIEANIGMVNSIALHFKNRGHEFEDITEVGKIGLIKAIEGYDELSGNSFSTYAFYLITGEIKRFLRDDGLIKISRTAKKNAHNVLCAKEEYIKKHGKEPKISELATLCSLSQEDIIDALEAMMPVMSLQEKIGSDESATTLCDIIPDDDDISAITEIIALRQSLCKLEEKEKKLIELRFFKEFTQSRTARVLGVSQVTVSRLEKTILEKLKQQMII